MLWTNAGLVSTERINQDTGVVGVGLEFRMLDAVREEADVANAVVFLALDEAKFISAK